MLLHRAALHSNFLYSTILLVPQHQYLSGLFMILISRSPTTKVFLNQHICTGFFGYYSLIDHEKPEIPHNVLKLLSKIDQSYIQFALII
jgi:hypothetical protein